MFSRSRAQATDSYLPTGRIANALVVFAIVAVVAIAIGASAAAAQDGNETANETADQIIHDFAESDVVLREVHFENSSAFVTLESDSREPVTVADTGKQGTGRFAVTSTHVEGTETIEIRIRDDEVVSISTPQDGFQYEGDVSLLNVIQNAPTAGLIQWAAISGMIGTLMALSLVVTALRRNHENTYKELTSQERIKVKRDPVDGLVDNIKRTVTDNLALFVFFGLLTMYSAFWFVGRVPGPVGIWNGMSDGMRIIAVGSAIIMLMALVPVFVLARRLWNPAKEFVFSCDSRDVIEEALGSDGGLKEMVEAVEEMSDKEDTDGNYAVAVYSGSPERIADMDVDGATTDSKAPGGPAHFVQSFNPETNAARGTWPGVADDFELIAERGKIDGNREILRDESDMLRSIMTAMPAISIASDTGAARATDRELRNALAVDQSPVDNILGRAAQGTRFEGYWTESEDETIEYEENENEDDQDEENEAKNE